MLSSSEGPKALEASQHVIGLPCIMHHTKYHTMMTSWHGKAFPLLTLCEGNPSITGGFPHKGPVMQVLMCHLLLAWIIFESNNRDGNGWRRHDTHVTSLLWFVLISAPWTCHTTIPTAQLLGVMSLLVKRGQKRIQREWLPVGVTCKMECLQVKGRNENGKHDVDVKIRSHMRLLKLEREKVLHKRIGAFMH